MKLFLGAAVVTSLLCTNKVAAQDVDSSRLLKLENQIDKKEKKEARLQKKVDKKQKKLDRQERKLSRKERKKEREEKKLRKQQEKIEKGENGAATRLQRAVRYPVASNWGNYFYLT